MKTILISLFLTVTTICGFSNDPEITVPLRFDHYYDYDQLVEAMKALNNAYPELSDLKLVGKSSKGFHL